MRLQLPAHFETGIAPVDADHRRLLELISEAIPLLLQERPGADVGSMLERLRTHLAQHFATEEALMARHGLDVRHAGPHREAHQLLRQRLDEATRQFAADQPPAGLGLSFLTMLIEWLCLHVFDLDQRLADQMRRIAAGASPDAAYAANRLVALPETVRSYLVDALMGVFAELCALKEQQRQVLAQAQSGALDLLTGLPARERFIADLRQAMTQPDPRCQAMVVMQIHVDGVREINQTLGMAFTDSLLVEVARRLREHSRREDRLARIGNGEFIVALVGGDEHAAMLEAAQRFYRQVCDGLMTVVREEGFTLSAGMAVWPGDAADVEELMAAAESAMTAAQREGGGNLRQYDPANGQVGSLRVRAVEELRNALRNNELVLHYQPQLALYSGEIIGLEALVRWQHPLRGLVPPGHFIPLAEETGLIVPLGEWVLAAALEQSRRWQDAGLPPVRIAVNISARHFRQADLADRVDELLERTGVAPHLLEIELTESVMVGEPLEVIRTVDRLKQRGVRLALDDFGTGYSSLAYLSRFAIDTIKVDQSFVSDITRNPANASIVQATIAMAHKLGKSVIAEGVETLEQMHYLRNHDCDDMQGYLFSRPLPAAAIATLLREGRVLEALQTDEADRLCLLLVDDEPNVLSALKRLLRREGYRILVAQGGAQGLDILATNRVEVILSDQRMPEMTGSEFLSRVKVLYPNTVRMVLSGYSELAAVTDAVNRGAIYKFLYKPWKDDELKTEIRAAFRHQRERTVVPE